MSRLIDPRDCFYREFIRRIDNGTIDRKRSSPETGIISRKKWACKASGRFTANRALDFIFRKPPCNSRTTELG